MSRIAGFASLAADPRIVRRAFLTALVVGTILTVVNHGPEILAKGVTIELLWPVLVTFATPYLVATASCVATLRDNTDAERRNLQGSRKGRRASG